MYLGTCFGVQMSNIDNKNTIRSLSSLTNEDQKEFEGEVLCEPARQNPLNSNA